MTTCYNDRCKQEKEAHTMKMCKACGCAFYCSAACQKADWKGHKPGCMLARENEEDP